MKTKIILASQSISRRQQLEQLGCVFSQQPAHINEKELAKNGEFAPSELALFLAQKKAEKVRSECSDPEALIIASDQLVAIDDEILGKPGSFEANVRSLRSLGGRGHDLFTSLVIDYRGQQKFHVDHTHLKMRHLTLAEIEAYVTHDEPFDCAGGYRLEKAGISLFTQIESKDFSAIQGLPLIALTEMFKELELPLPFQMKGSL